MFGNLALLGIFIFKTNSMKLTTKKIQVAELDDRDLEVIKHALNYCVHRIRHHDKIIPFLDIEEIERLRREMKII
jgi:hypothetical protein